jgi:hypothetical protein
MATATAHPNHQLISSEDVEGTNVYDMKGGKIGEIDHLMIDKISGRVTYAVMSFGGFLGLRHSHYRCVGRASSIRRSATSAPTSQSSSSDAPQLTMTWGDRSGDAHAQVPLSTGSWARASGAEGKSRRSVQRGGSPKSFSD